MRIEFCCVKNKLVHLQIQTKLALWLYLLYCTITSECFQGLKACQRIRQLDGWGARKKGCYHLKRDISGCKWLHPEFQCRPLIQHSHSGQNWPSLLVMLEQRGRSYPIIPGDAAKQWTAGDPGQTPALTISYTRTCLYFPLAWFLPEFDRNSTVATLLSHRKGLHYAHSPDQKICKKVIAIWRIIEGLRPFKPF